MSKSRYNDTDIINNHHYATYSLPVLARGLRDRNLLDGVKTVDYTYKRGDRLDHVSARFFNDDQYWWVIALCNGIIYPFPSGGLVPGRVLKIPVDIKDVFDKIFKT